VVGYTEVEAVTESLLLASRVFVALAAQSVADLLSDLTLPQYRVLVVLSTTGPQNLGSLAHSLDVNPSTASRLCERLVRRRLIRRQTSRSDRREVRLSITDSGRELFEQVIERRRKKVADLVQTLDPDTREHLVVGLRALAEAYGEAPEQPWSLGWSVPHPPSDGDEGR
jgi:DNA-binding MarR family transcriptional regulator